MGAELNKKLNFSEVVCHCILLYTFKSKSLLKGKMPLLYTVVARKNVVLARHAMTVGNFAEVTELVLSKIDETKNKKMSYSSDSYMYHYVYAENKSNTQFAGRSASTSVPLALNNELAPIFAAEMKKFNLIEDQNKLMPVGEGEEAGTSDKVQMVRNEVDRVKDIMVANVETLMDRGERLELLVDKTENLSQHSVSFRRAGRQIRRQYWWENTKMKIAVAFGIIIAIYIIVSISCGGLDWKKCV